MYHLFLLCWHEVCICELRYMYEGTPSLFQIIRRFGFSKYIIFVMYLDIDI
jgi:hypothetical protein